MEPECSLPHSQVPATCPYTVPARSSYKHVLSAWKFEFKLDIKLFWPNAVGQKCISSVTHVLNLSRR